MSTQTPEAPTFPSLPPENNQPGTPNKKSRRKPVILTVGSVVLAGVLAGGGYALAHAPQHKDGTSQTGKPTSAPTPSKKEKSFTVRELLIPTTLNTEQIAVKFEADWDATQNANETYAFYKEIVLNKTSIAEQVQKDVATFDEAVMQSGYENKPVLANMVGVNGLLKTHSAILTDWFATHGEANAADHKPYHTWTTINPKTAADPQGGVTTIAQSPTSLELKIPITNHNNGNENTVGPNTANGQQYIDDVTFVEENGDWKLSNIDVTNVQ